MILFIISFFFRSLSFPFFALPHRFRWCLLLAASCYFYMVLIPVYILVLSFTILIDYSAGLLLERASGQTRKWLLVASLTSNLGILAAFKYFNFFNANLSALAHFMHWGYSIQALPDSAPV